MNELLCDSSTVDAVSVLLNIVSFLCIFGMGVVAIALVEDFDFLLSDCAAVRDEYAQLQWECDRTTSLLPTMPDDLLAHLPAPRTTLPVETFDSSPEDLAVAYFSSLLGLTAPTTAKMSTQASEDPVPNRAPMLPPPPRLSLV
tara:strand:+ start:37253 stop:37681 length:429 start_codon:yes stop_codon:yes gene_type:complete